MDEHGYSPRRPKRRIWLYLFLIFFVIAAGGAGWFLGHDERQTAALPFQSSHAQAVPEVQIPHAQRAQQPPGREQPSVASASGHLSEPKATLRPSQMERPAGERIPASHAAQAGSVPEKKPDPNRLYAVSELPEPVSKGLPSFIISTHIYSTEPVERLASINGNIGREGQEIIPGIFLISVLPDGVILKHQGYRFMVKLK